MGVFSRSITHSQELSILSKAVTIVLSGNSSLVVVLEWATITDIQDAETSSDVFQHGLGKYLITEYCTNFGVPYVDALLGKCIRENAEIYRKRTAEPDIDDSEKIKDIANNVLTSICKGGDLCPTEFRYLFKCVATHAKEKFSSEYKQIVSSMFFINFVFPPLFQPEHYGCTKENTFPYDTAVALSNLLKSIFLLSQPSPKMAKYTDFIQTWQPKVKSFITKLTGTVQNPESVVAVPNCTGDSVTVALNCIHYYIYWYLQDITLTNKAENHPLIKLHRLIQAWELLSGKPDPVSEKDLRIDYVYIPKTARGTRQGFFKRKKTTVIGPVAHLTSKHQSHIKHLEDQSGIQSPLGTPKHMNEESADDSEKISGESSSAADSEYSQSLSETEEMRLQAGCISLRGHNKKGSRRSNITMTTAHQIHEKKIAAFNLKLMQSLIYRQERDNQVRQAALRLKYNYFPSLDDDLWDWHRASPRSRGSLLRDVIARREYNSSVLIHPAVETKKVKKLTKIDKKQSANALPRPESMTGSPSKPIKRVTRRSNTTDSQDSQETEKEM
jgi:hypothetical protein